MCRLPRISYMTGRKEFSKYLGKKGNNSFGLVCLLGNGLGMDKSGRGGGSQMSGGGFSIRKSIPNIG